MKTSLVLGVAVTGLLLFSGCGGDTSTGVAKSDSTSTSAAGSSTPPPTESPSLEGVPLCTKVWQDGAKLTRSYAGCREGDQLVKPDARMCEFGVKLYTYDDHFYAVRGGTIHRTPTVLDKDKGYQDALASCTA